MHAITILHRILSTSFPEIHAKRLTSLLAAVGAVVSGSRLTLSDMGRGLSGTVAVKHSIKRIDRLLGTTLEPMWGKRQLDMRIIMRIIIRIIFT